MSSCIVVGFSDPQLAWLAIEYYNSYADTAALYNAILRAAQAGLDSAVIQTLLWSAVKDEDLLQIHSEQHLERPIVIYCDNDARRALQAFEHNDAMDAAAEEAVRAARNHGTYGR